MSEGEKSWSEKTISEKTIHVGQICGALSAVGALCWGIYFAFGWLFAADPLRIEFSESKFVLPKSAEIVFEKPLNAGESENDDGFSALGYKLESADYQEEIEITNQSDAIVEKVTILLDVSAVVEIKRESGRVEISHEETRVQLGKLEVDEKVRLRLWKSIQGYSAIDCVYDGGRQNVKPSKYGTGWQFPVFIILLVLTVWSWLAGQVALARKAENADQSGEDPTRESDDTQAG